MALFSGVDSRWALWRGRKIFFKAAPYLASLRPLAAITPLEAGVRANEARSQGFRVVTYVTCRGVLDGGAVSVKSLWRGYAAGM